jgi:hypothetical protein
LLKTREEHLRRWKEHFIEFLNREDIAVDERTRANSKLTNPNISLHTPTNAEIVATLKQINNGKAPGIDNIAPEVLKIDMVTMAKIIQPVLKIRYEEEIPVDWKKGLIIKLPKYGDITNCNISPTVITGGVSLSCQSQVSIIKNSLNRIKESIEQ